MKRKLFALTRGAVMTGTGLCALAGLGVLIPTPAQAIFGFGDIVFDPSSFATLGHIWEEDISTGQKLIQEFNQLVKIYTANKQLYDHAVLMSQRISHPQRMSWYTLTRNAVNDATQNSYGETINWPTMVNGQPRWAGSAWTAATVGVQPNVALRNEQVGNSAALARLASVEAIDGSATKCLATIAQYRADAAANRNAQTNLQKAEMDDSDATNSEIEQLNLLNTAQAQAANEQRSQNNMQTCLIEQQVLANKMERDSLAGHLNFFTGVQRYDTTEGNAWIGAGTFLNSH